MCIVTGASRGIGRGIALVLSRDEGHIVYATGRSQKSLEALAAEVNSNASRGELIPVVVDHSNDNDVRKLIARVLREQRGIIDVLVNNAYGGVRVIGENFGKMFWEKDLSQWDASHCVGLRSHYVASALVAPSMVSRRRGLIVNVSSGGGREYLFDVAYGVGKAALDRMGADMAVELKPFGVSVLTLWPGAVRTETTDFGANAESVEYSGKAVAALMKKATKAELARMTGKIVQTGELAEMFGFTDVNGQRPGRDGQAKLRKLMAMPPTHWSLDTELPTAATNSVAFKAAFKGQSKL